MAYRDAIRFILSEGENLAQSILADFPTQKEQNYPLYGPGPLHFITFLEEFTKGTLTDLLWVRGQVDESSVELQEDLFREAKRSNIVLRYITELLELVRGASVEDLPFPLVPSCEASLRRFHPDACIIFKSTLDYNYEIITIPKSTIAKLAPRRVVDKHHWPLIVIRIPSRPIADTATHVLIAHEIGHAIYNAGRPVKPSVQSTSEEIANIARKLLAPLLPAGSHISFDDLIKTDLGRKLVASIGRRVSGVVEDWIQEIFSDTIGCLLMGPAFLFAYVSFLGSFMALDQSRDTHPSTRLRTANILTVLRRRRYRGDVVARHGAALLKAWEVALKELPEEQVKPGEEVDQAVWELAGNIVFLSLTKVRRAATDRVKAVAYRSNSYKEDVDEFVKLLLDERIPPIERTSRQSGRKGTMVALDLASVLNVGWEAILSRHIASSKKASPTAEELATAAESAFRTREKLNEMILRAIELGEVRRTWEGVHVHAIGG